MGNVATSCVRVTGCFGWFPWVLLSAHLVLSAGLPVVVVTRDDTVLTRSCRVVFPQVVADANGDGVLHVGAGNITVEFEAGTALRGAPEGTDGDRLRGIGLRIDGHANVRIRNARIHGFFNGVVASRADGLVIDGGDFSDNYRQRLRSTPEAEDGADWLFPHHNDDRKWRDEYGGAVCIESSCRVTVRGMRVRRTQNGILLDRVDDSSVHDNDASFLSGWGVALWRSSRNMIARNALDFCVRGHSEGVYNRGQDSAGILCFEQCHQNVFAENSATHGGDGFFGFAGQDAIGERWMQRERERLRRGAAPGAPEPTVLVPPDVVRAHATRGCNSNILLGNDFSHASAHGVEMTFSHGNALLSNRIRGNGICGFWGGYSTRTLVAFNTFTDNGALGYGLERGAINMEHASSNVVARNAFIDNRVGVHLWWDDDDALMRLPGVMAHDAGVSGNVIAGNSFVFSTTPSFGVRGPSDTLWALQLRDVPGGRHLTGNAYFNNQVNLSHSNAVELSVPPGTTLLASAPMPSFADLLQPPGMSARRRGDLTYRSRLLPVPRFTIPGTSRPVGARAHLGGRHSILLDEWGPWDHESPFVIARGANLGGPAWDVHGVGHVRARVLQSDATVAVEPIPGMEGQRVTLRTRPGVTEYEVEVAGDGFQRRIAGTTLRAEWEAVFFSWRNGPDPRTNLVEWRALASGPGATRARLSSLSLPYGGRGPRDMGLSDEVTRSGPVGERFGMVATTRLPLPKGSWVLRVSSDDGVRVRVDGRVVVENWTWHGPERNEAVFEAPGGRDVHIEVEHFEIDGHAELKVDLKARPLRNVGL